MDQRFDFWWTIGQLKDTLQRIRIVLNVEGILELN